VDREKRNEQLQGITDEFIRRYGGRDKWRQVVQQNPSWARSRLEEYLSQRAKQIGGVSAEEQAFIYGYANLPPDTRARLSGIGVDTKPLVSQMRLTTTTDSASAEKNKNDVNSRDGGNGMDKLNGGGNNDKQRERQHVRRHEQQQQNPNNMYPIANVFRDFYGGNVGEAYQWSASDEPVENGSPIRRVHVFRNPEDQQTRFYFEPEADGNWALKHVSGQAIAHGLVYNPKERRFYATNDVTPQQMLQALRQFQAAQATGNGAPSSGGDPNAQRLPGAVQFLDVGNGRYAWVGIDGKLHYGMRANDGTMISERSMPLDQVFNPPQQQAPENSMNWLMTMLPLLLLILARR